MEIYLMQHLWLSIFIISISFSCTSSSQKQDTSSKKASTDPSFTFDQSLVAFTVSDSSGYNLTFNKNKDSTFYHYFRFRKPEDVRSLGPMLPVLSRMWHEADRKIDIQLNSLSLGYPLEYDDVLTHQIQVFATSDRWQHHLKSHGKNVDYRMVEEIMYTNNIFPLDELLLDFGYQLIGFSVEKVGFIQPERLIGLGFDESLIIPVPYMVWIQVAQSPNYDR